MWLLLSTRLRTWLLITVGVPLARMLLHRIATLTARRAPDGQAARVLGRADSTLAGFRRNRGRRSR